MKIKYLALIGCLTPIFSHSMVLIPPPNQPFLQFSDSIVYEDGSVQLAIFANTEFLDGSESLRVRVRGITSGWGVDTTLSGGSYNANTGTWLIDLAPGVGFSGGPVLAPPSDSDADLLDLDVLARTTQVATGQRASTTGLLDVTTDAVADAPSISANDLFIDEFTNQTNLLINGSLNDTDGSESLDFFQISGLTDGLSLSHGADFGNGTWQIAPDDISLVNLLLADDSDCRQSGCDLSLTALLQSSETNKSDLDFDLTNDTTISSTTFNLTIEASPVPLPAAAWLFGSGLIGLTVIKKQRNFA